MVASTRMHEREYVAHRSILRKVAPCAQDEVRVAVHALQQFGRFTHDFPWGACPQSPDWIDVPHDHDFAVYRTPLLPGDWQSGWTYGLTGVR